MGANDNKMGVGSPSDFVSDEKDVPLCVKVLSHADLAKIDDPHGEWQERTAFLIMTLDIGRPGCRCGR